MVSPIPYTHAAKWLLSVRRNRKRELLLAAMLLVVVFFRFGGLAVIVTLYIFAGPILALFRFFRRRATEKGQTADADPAGKAG